MRKSPRFAVCADNSGGATIQTVGNVPLFGNGYIIGHIFWSGARSDFYTVEIRERDPLKDDTAYFIAGTATTFDAAVRLASDFLAERLAVSL